jgi:hypothetical protein
VGNLFRYGFPPPEQSFAKSDIIVVVRDSWEELVAVWSSVGIPAITGSIRPYANMIAGQPHVSVVLVTAPDGHTIRVYNYVRIAEGEAQNERCMARDIINDSYLGLSASDFNSFACSRALR